MIKKAILFLIIILLVAGGIFLVKKRKKEAASANKPLPPVYSVKGTKIERGSVLMSRSFLGKIEPDQRVKISSKITGYIKNVYFTAGDIVKKGDLIAEIDDTQIKLAVKNLKHQKASLLFQKNSLEETLKNAESDFTFIKNKFKRDKALYESGAISLEEFQKSENIFENYRNKIISIKNSIKSLDERISSLLTEIDSKRHDLTYTEVYSQFTGKVTKEFLKKGSLAVPGSPILEMESTENYKLTVAIPPDIAKIINKNSYMEINLNNKKLRLEIKKFYPMSSYGNLLTVEGRIKEIPINIPSNSFINVFIVFKKKCGLTVDKNALLQTTEGAFVLKNVKNVFVKKRVKVILCDNLKCIVKGDIKEGEIVATGMENKLRLLASGARGKMERF